MKVEYDRDGTEVTIKLPKDLTLRETANIVADLAYDIGEEKVYVDVRGVGVGLSDMLFETRRTENTLIFGVHNWNGVNWS